MMSCMIYSLFQLMDKYSDAVRTHVVDDMTSLIIIDRIDDFIKPIGFVSIEILRLSSVPRVWSRVSNMPQNRL